MYCVLHALSRRLRNGRPCGAVRQCVKSTDTPAALQLDDPQLVSSLQGLSRQLADCSTLEQLLAMPQQRALTLSNQLQVLTVAAQRAVRDGAPVSALTSQLWYRQLAQPAHGQLHDLAPSHLLTAAGALLQLKVPPDDKVLLSLVNDITWNVRKMSIAQLVWALELACQLRDAQSSGSGSGQSSPALLNQVATALQQRWVEITAPDHTVALLRRRGLFTSQFLEQLEERALDTAASLTASQSAFLLSGLAAARRRPVPLLRSITYHAARRAEPLALREAVTMLHALHRLNFPDECLLERLGRDLPAQLESVERASAVSGLLTAAGRLSWRHTELLEASCQWCQQRLQQLLPQDALAVIQTLAAVNFVPSMADALLPALVSICGDLESPQQRLELVWSLAVLERASAQQLTAVLQPQQLLQLNSGQLTVGTQLKLLNIAALARLRHGYTGPHTASELGLRLPSNGADGSTELLPRSAAARQLRRSVVDTLQLLVPPPRHLRAEPLAVGGVAADAEFCVDAAGAPVPLPAQSAPAPPPPGQFRVALRTWAFHDLTRDSVELTGVSQMCVRVLEASGFHVLQLRHTEVSGSDTAVQRAKQLHSKIQQLATEAAAARPHR